jgi:DNA repair exonuclease SbcCD ATPase subunit
LDFEEIQGFWEIHGNVGAGKTAIGEAILFGLFGNLKQYKMADLVRWGTKQCNIDITCVCKGQVLDIHRTLTLKGSSLSVDVDGAPIVFTNKNDAEHILEAEYYDVSRIILEQLCVISFNGFKSLSTMNPSDTKKFLDYAFGFHMLTEYCNICMELQKKHKEERDGENNKYNSVKMQIERFEEWASKNISVGKADLVEAKGRVDAAQKALWDYNNETRKTLNEYNTKKSEINTQLTTIKTNGQRVAKDIAFIQKGVCPTCGAPLDQSHLHEFEKQRDDLRVQYTEFSDKQKDVERAADEYRRGRLDGARELQSKYDDMTQEYTTLKYRESLQNDCSIDIDKYRSEMDMLSDTIVRLDGALMKWDELLDFINVNVRTNILSYMVPKINYYIGEYLEMLHQPYIVEFDKSFHCEIRVSGMSKTIPTSVLSTGQLKMVDVVIILSILRVLMSSVNFNICFIDELLSNMDEEMRDVMCQLLKSNKQTGQTIFVIGHAQLRDDLFDGCIHVKNISGSSTYVINRK